ncbi:MAG: hypothetical protein AAGU77_02605 [Bacillota bacterium]
MDDNAIKLLYINSAVRALISINQVPAGETGTGAITQPVGAGASFFISMLPLESEPGFVYLPYTRRISLSSATADASDGLAEICTWPENIVEVTLHPLAVYRYEAKELTPSILCPYDFYLGAERFTAFIYNEAYSSFAVEHAQTGRVKFIAPLPFSVSQAQINFIKIEEHPLLLASGLTAERQSFVYAAEPVPEIRTVVCETCLTHNVERSSLTLVRQGGFYEERIRYMRQGEGLQCAGTEIGWFSGTAREPVSPREVCDALVQAVGAGAADAAMRCLTSSLAEGLGFEDLKEFFGDFVQAGPAISPACSQSGFALKYAAGARRFTAREFCVETRQEKGALRIDNIREP